MEGALTITGSQALLILAGAGSVIGTLFMLLMKEKDKRIDGRGELLEKGFERETAQTEALRALTDAIKSGAVE